MSEPTDAELDAIARAILDDAQRLPRPTEDGRVGPTWARTMARAAWSLGARHDGRGTLHGPVEDLRNMRGPR